MKKYLLFLLIILPNLIKAQTEVTFLDNISHEPIPAVLVRANNNYSAVANDMGVIKLDVSAPQEMMAFHIAYEKKAFSVNPNEPMHIFLDRVELSLSEVLVSSFETQRPLLEQAAAIHKIPETDLYRFNETSLVNA